MIIVIQGQIVHYRKAFFNELSKNERVIVVHSGSKSKNSNDKFEEVILPKKNFGPFTFQLGLSKLIKHENPSTVIAMFDIKWINSVFSMFIFDRRKNWIWWGLDRGKNSTALKIKCWISKRNNPIVFYSENIRRNFLEFGLESKKLFVANNTFYVKSAVPCFEWAIKNSFINVGSLNKRKQNDITIKSFKTVLHETRKDLKLLLIGDGEDRDRLERLVINEGLSDHVIFLGEIDDPIALKKYYQEAIASVSYGQAGLAVLQSMAFGVPFITKYSAISGGEKFNIIDGVNGFFCDDTQKSLVDIMIKLVKNPLVASKAGENAYYYYNNNATLKNMVNGFLLAKKYAEDCRA